MYYKWTKNTHPWIRTHYFSLTASCIRTNRCILNRPFSLVGLQIEVNRAVEWSHSLRRVYKTDFLPVLARFTGTKSSQEW